MREGRNFLNGSEGRKMNDSGVTAAAAGRKMNSEGRTEGRNLNGSDSE